MNRQRHITPPRSNWVRFRPAAEEVPVNDRVPPLPQAGFYACPCMISSIHPSVSFGKRRGGIEVYKRRLLIGRLTSAYLTQVRDGVGGEFKKKTGDSWRVYTQRTPEGILWTAGLRSPPPLSPLQRLVQTLDWLHFSSARASFGAGIQVKGAPNNNNLFILYTIPFSLFPSLLPSAKRKREKSTEASPEFSLSLSQSVHVLGGEKVRPSSCLVGKIFHVVLISFHVFGATQAVV